MSSLYRPGAGRKEKAFTLFFIGSCISGIFVFFSNISPSELVTRNIVPLSLTLSLVYFLPLVFDRKIRDRLRDQSLFKRITIYPVAFAFSYALALILVAYVIPHFFTSAFGKPYEFQAVVESKGSNTKGCRHDIKLQGFGYGIHAGICANKQQWESVQPGDVIYIRSLKSVLGIKATGMAIDSQKTNQAPGPTP